MNETVVRHRDEIPAIKTQLADGITLKRDQTRFGVSLDLEGINRITLLLFMDAYRDRHHEWQNLWRLGGFNKALSLHDLLQGRTVDIESFATQTEDPNTLLQLALKQILACEAVLKVRYIEECAGGEHTFLHPNPIVVQLQIGNAVISTFPSAATIEPLIRF